MTAVELTVQEISLKTSSIAKPVNQEIQEVGISVIGSRDAKRPIVAAVQTRNMPMSSPSKRREMDLMKLMMSDYKVEMMNDGMHEFYVDFNGPVDRHGRNERSFSGGTKCVRR